MIQLHLHSFAKLSALSLPDWHVEWFLWTAHRWCSDTTLSCLTHRHPILLPLQQHPVVLNCSFHHWMLLSDGDLLLSCYQKAPWKVTTGPPFTNCRTQNAFCLGIAIFCQCDRGDKSASTLQNSLLPCLFHTYLCLLLYPTGHEKLQSYRCHFFFFFSFVVFYKCSGFVIGFCPLCCLCRMVWHRSL